MFTSPTITCFSLFRGVLWWHPILWVIIVRTVREKLCVQISRRTETADMKLVFTILPIFIALCTGQWQVHCKSILRSTNLAAALVSVISPGSIVYRLTPKEPLFRETTVSIIDHSTENIFFLWHLKLFPFCFFAIMYVTEQSSHYGSWLYWISKFMFRKRVYFYV